MFSSFRHDRLLWLILAGFLFLAVAYSVINPIHEGTDELRHYRFVRYLVENGQLPVQGEEPCRSQSHHPPLFYAAGALLTSWVDTGREVCTSPVSNPFWAYRYWDVGTDNKNMYIHPPAEGFPWSGEPLAAHLIRLLNVFIGAIAVFLTYLTGRLIWPEKPAYAAGGAAFLAFNPMFLYMAGTINNDVIAAMSGALVMYTAVRLLYKRDGIQDPTLTGFVLGVVYVIALLSKFSLAPMILPLIAGLFLITHWKKQVREWFTANLILGVTTVALSGWWFARNAYHYGDPTGFNPVTELWGVRTPSESWGLVWLELPNVWSSLWGRFGFGQIPLPEEVYQGLWITTYLALGGAILWLLLRAADRLVGANSRLEAVYTRRETIFSLLLLLLIVGLTVAVVISYMLLSPAGAMGRFLFPGLPAFALLLFWGITRWAALLGRPSRRLINFLAISCNSAMIILSVVALGGYLRPAYAVPSNWTADQIPQGAVRTDVVFEPFIKLHAVEAGPETIRPGEKVELTLYWEVLAAPPGDYYFFVHLIDDVETMVTQRDTHPVTGKYPAGLWQVGDRFVDHIAVYVPETAYPASARLQIGFYAPNEGYRLSVSSAGISQGDAYTVDQLTITTNTDYVPLDLNFENQASLLGYQYSGRDLNPDETTEVTLFWGYPPDTNLKNLEVNLHLGDSSTTPLSTLPLEAAEPIVFNGQSAYATRHLVTIPADHPPGKDLFTITLFDIFTRKRLNMIAERGNWIDNELPLAGIRISGMP